MEGIFPDVLFVSQCGSGEDIYLNASKTEVDAIKATDDGSTALVAEYKLVRVRNRSIHTSVINAS